MQGTWVQSLVQEDPSCQGATKPVHHATATALTSNTEEAEVEQFYEDLQDLLELTPKKDVLFIIGD